MFSIHLTKKSDSVNSPDLEKGGEKSAGFHSILAKASDEISISHILVKESDEIGHSHVLVKE
jgi:hypothetical protein